MHIAKAVITAAGRNQRTLPLQTLIDRDGEEKSVLAILLDEVHRAGIEEVGLVVRPGDEEPYAAIVGHQATHVHFVHQAEPMGHGHAVYCARDFVSEDPFLHLVDDHLYVSSEQRSCAQQLTAIAASEQCAVFAVQATRETLLPYYGALSGRRLQGQPSMYEVETVIEKPTPTVAEQQLVVSGLCAGHYLCFFGMHVLTNTVMQILGEWIGGSGGGWQDSGGVWPGMKLIVGTEAGEGDPEYGISRGRLLPNHTILSHDDVSTLTRRKLQDSLVLVHGGMAQDVGPVLEMVTEKYLLRFEAEWRGRQEAIALYDRIVTLLHEGDVHAIGAATERNFRGPIQTIIPWATNLYTELLIERVRAEFGDQFWGFWMLGGMAGGGMGFIFDPSRRREAQERLQAIMSATKRQLESSTPFAM